MKKLRVFVVFSFLGQLSICHTVRCARPACPRGIVYTPPNSCCPVCLGLPTVPLPPSCAYTICAQPDCMSGETYTPPGECCPRCRDKSTTLPASCAYTTCLANPTCPPGQELYRPPNECCYQCRIRY